MLKNIQRLRRTGLIATGLLLGTITAIPALLNSYVGAVGSQVTTRSVKLGVSTPGATTTYTVSFKPVTTEQEFIIDFCSNDPIVTDGCTFTAGTDTPLTTGVSSGTGTGTSLSGNHTVKVVGLTMTGGVQQTIVLSGIVNPSNVGAAGTFYARILTYATGNASGYTPGTTPTLGTYVDFGGVALSTASNINITSKVFETLSFCVFQTSCGTPASLALGDATTGALSSAATEIDAQAQYTLASNAGTSVVVTMTGQTLCRAATINFANCPTGASASTISAAGTTAVVKTIGSEQFGMCAGKNGSAALTVATAYNDTVNNCPGTATTTGTYAGTSLFGFDDTNTTGTNSTGGSTVVSSSGAVTSVTSNFAFIGNIATTTEAGIYQSNLNMVATGTF